MSTAARPLALGDMIGHRMTGGGTLGFFARRQGKAGFVSIAPVLAPSGARLGDWVYRTSPSPLSQISPASRVGRLAAFNDTAAFAELSDDVAWTGNQTSSAPFGEILAEPEPGVTVGKIGAATWLTTGQLTSILSHVVVQSSTTETVEVRDVLEVTSGRIFSHPGDGGALVYTYEAGKVPRPIGIIFAGMITQDLSTTGGAIHRTYVLPLRGICDRLDVVFEPG